MKEERKGKRKFNAITIVCAMGCRDGSQGR